MVSRLISAWHARQTLRDISLLLGEQNLTLVDVGSAGGVEPRWKKIASKIHYVGFEPDARSQAEDSAHHGGFAAYTLWPSAVWSHDGSLEIHLCRKPEVSSCYLPNNEFTSRFPKAQRFEVVGKAEVRAHKLDSLPIGRCDFIKLDIQGGELAALKGAENLLSSTLGLEVEVEFSAVYKDQPLFGEVSAYLNKQGFEFVDFTNLARWDRYNRKGIGQCVFADALFLRSPEWVCLNGKSLDVVRIRRYLAILALYRRADMMRACCHLCEDKLPERDILKAQANTVIQRINRHLFFIRKLSELSSSILKLIGGQSRCYVTY